MPTATPTQPRSRRLGDGYSVPRKHLDKLFAGIIGFVLAVLAAQLPQLQGKQTGHAVTEQAATVTAQAAEPLGERLARVETEVKNLTAAIQQLTARFDNERVKP
jgi:hypothetical protein